MKERQDELADVVGGPVVGVVRARDHLQLTELDQPGGGLRPGLGP